MTKKSQGILSSLCLLLLLGCPNPVSDLPTDQVITLLEIPGVVVPASGAAPVTTPIDTAQYTGTIEWSPADNPFADATVYTALIALTAKPGWTLSGIEANTFTVPGASATNAANSGSVTAIFPETSAPVDQTITLLEIPGVVTPVRGAVPVTTAIDTVQYTGTITWDPSDNPYSPDTVYTANITLTPKTGWKLDGVAADSFTVSDASATNLANSGTVTAEFPVTSSLLDYDSANIGVLKYVPSGSFQRDPDVNNISTISTAFRMSRYEITRAQFLAIMGTDPSDTAHSLGTRDPVQMVNWYLAIAFCNKLSIAEGLTPVYSVSGVDFATLTYADMSSINVSDWNAATATWTNDGYRLPTEMEFDWAQMGATSDRSNGYTGTGINTTGYTKGYAGSTESADAQVNVSDYAWYFTNSGDTSHPVGTTGITGHPNELGLFDMSGNVMEWCWDWYAGDGSDTNFAITGTVIDHRGADSGIYRTRPGGSWRSAGSSLKVAFRNWANPGYADNRFGFRVVRP